MNGEITALKAEIVTMKRRQAYEVSLAVKVRHEYDLRWSGAEHMACKDYWGGANDPELDVLTILAPSQKKESHCFTGQTD